MMKLPGIKSVAIAVVNSLVRPAPPQIETAFCCRSSRVPFLMYATLDVARDHRQEQCHRQAVIVDKHV